MRPLWEYEEEFSSTGKRLKRRYSIGAVVAWLIVAVLTILLGRGVVPAVFWTFIIGN